ncbi:MAG: protease complex subunit PrcB family protein [Chloroflexota bacterium]|nr:protease complex subunit PrcB family protein [Chloroflexota bacterium]
MAIRRNGKMNWLLLPMFTLLLGLSACKPQETNLPFEIVEQEERNLTGEIYEAREPGLIVVAQSDEVAELDDWVTETSKEQFQVMDYDACLALVVFQGMKPTDGYGVRIERVVRESNEVTIYAQFQKPHSDQKKNDIVTSPYSLTQVQKTDTWNQNIKFNVIVDDSVVISASHSIP